MDGREAVQDPKFALLVANSASPIGPRKAKLETTLFDVNSGTTHQTTLVQVKVYCPKCF
jgi:hypothetical protein